jgi:hypothetical protein
MSTTQESLFVLDLLDAGKINVSEAETLINALHPQSGRRSLAREPRVPDAISVTMDGTQADLDEVMHKLSAAFEAAVPDEVN